jgi:hypothetical protein
VCLCAGPGEAQVLPGDSPSSGVGAAVRNSRSKPILGLSKGMEYKATNYDTRGAMPPPPKSKTPHKQKSPHDPWADVRSIQSTDSSDRYRPN